MTRFHDSETPLPRRMGRFRFRPEFGTLQQWWRNGGPGVCVLAGGFGTGKTMLLAEFLDWMRDLEQTDLDRHRFVYSFDDDPSVERCVQRLYRWLKQLNNAPPQSEEVPALSELERELDQLNTRGLIVLDGFHRIQVHPAIDWSNRVPRDWAEIFDWLHCRAVNGAFVGASWLITSHSPPDSVREASAYLSQDFAERTGPQAGHVFAGGASHRYVSVPIGALPPEVCLNVLRVGYGIQGSDDALLGLAERLGFHAQAICLAGCYLATYRRRNVSDLPPQWLSLESLPSDSVSPASEYERQLRTLRVVLSSFQQELRGSRSPAVLALLQRLSLFLQPPTLDLLRRALDVESGMDTRVRKLKGDDLKDALSKLIELDLVHEVSDADNQTHYSVELALRDLIPPTLEKHLIPAHEAIAKALAIETEPIADVWTNSIWIPDETGQATKLRRDVFATVAPSGLLQSQQLVDEDALVERIHHLVCCGQLSKAIYALSQFYTNENLCRASQLVETALPTDLIEGVMCSAASAYKLHENEIWFLTFKSTRAHIAIRSLTDLHFRRTAMC